MTSQEAERRRPAEKLRAEKLRKKRMHRLKNITLGRLLVGFWRRRDKPNDPPPSFSMNPTDNVQKTMNLIMPLSDTSPIGRAEMAKALATEVSEVIGGLNNTQIVHFGRFTVIGGNLCMLSVYDGDFANYIRDFIYNVGSVFDAMMEFVVDPPRTPVADHPDEFVDWVYKHDAYQLSDNVADLSDDILKLPRRLALLMDEHENLQLFIYRAYSGHTVAQIHDQFHEGW